MAGPAVLWWCSTPACGCHRGSVSNPSPAAAPSNKASHPKPCLPRPRCMPLPTPRPPLPLPRPRGADTSKNRSSVPAFLLSPMARCLARISRKRARGSSPRSSSPRARRASLSLSFASRLASEGQWRRRSAFQASTSARSAAFWGSLTTGSSVTFSKGGTMSFLRCLLAGGGNNLG